MSFSIKIVFFISLYLVAHLMNDANAHMSLSPDNFDEDLSFNKFFSLFHF
jgi:hypothetical protein